MTILTKQRYGETKAKELGCDLVIDCMGYSFKTSFMNDNFKDCLAKNGQIYVNDLFQISNADPL